MTLEVPRVIAGADMAALRLPQVSPSCLPRRTPTLERRSGGHSTASVGRGEDARAIPARLSQKGTRPCTLSGASPPSLMTESYGEA